MQLLPPEYFIQPATILAPQLVGKLLCHSTDAGILRLRITETECYFGEEDSACHAHRGRTPRTDVMYATGGCAYVYLCYGIHALLNLVTGAEGHPEAVLIRGVEGYSGPGRVTKALQITLNENRKKLTQAEGLWLEDDGASPTICSAPRIGIDYANPEDRERAWRFFTQTIVKEHPHSS